MNQSIIQQVTQAITPLAQKLGQGAEQLYKIYTRQQFINGITYLIWALILTIASTVVYRLGKSIWKKEPDLDDARFFGGFVLVLAVALLVGAVVLLTSGLQHLLNPQYFTVQQIICTVKNCNGN